MSARQPSRLVSVSTEGPVHPPRRSGRAAVAVVAPRGEDAHGLATEIARLGRRPLAVTLPASVPVGDKPIVAADQPGAFEWTLRCDHGIRRLARRLRALNVQAVVAGSPQGLQLTDRLARELGLPGNGAISTAARCDVGAQVEALAACGIAAPRLLRTNSLDRAREWAAFMALPAYVVTAADTGVDVTESVCASPREIGEAWHAVRSTLPARGAGIGVAIREHLYGHRYVVHSISGRGDVAPAHTVTDVWARHRSVTGATDRLELLPQSALMARLLTPYILRVLSALQVSTGPMSCEVVYTPGRGPLLLRATPMPDTSPAGRAVRTTLGSDVYRDTVYGAIHGRVRQPVRSPGPLHLTRVPLLPSADGALDRWLLRTIRYLPTVTHVDAQLMPRVPVTAHVSPGELVLRSSAERAVEADYRVIRAIEQLGLYAGGCS